MPLFDITSGIKANYKSGATPQVSYDILKKVVVTFAKRGYQVEWQEQKPPTRLVAKLTDKEGTNLVAECSVVDEGTTTRCDMNIHGHVFLGGILGRLVSASTIQNRAQEKIKEMLDENFAGQPSKRAPVSQAQPKPQPQTTSPAPQPTPIASPPQPVAPPVTTSTNESWQQLVDRALSGATINDDTLIARASAASGALGDASLIQFVQIGLVQAIAKSKGKKLDRAGAVQVLTKIGASSSSQLELAKSTKSATAAAYALTAAVGEVAPRSFEDGVDEASLADLFGAAFEKHAGRVSSRLANGAGVADKLEQVKEAYDSDLISESEMLALKERVLVALA